MSEKVASKVLDVLYVVLGLLPFLLLCIRKACTKWDRKNDLVYEALRSPTVREARNAFDRRVALAIREAKHGACECRGCGFGNAQRAATCVLCGAALPVKAKRFFPRKRAATDDALDASGTMTSRQRRVRRRKEWTRRVDARGRVVWYHDETLRQPSAIGIAEFPAYVLQTTHVARTDDDVLNHEQREQDEQAAGSPLPHPASEQAVSPPAAAAAPEQEQAEQEDDAACVVVITVETAEPPTAPETTIEDAAQSLEQELQALEVRVVSTSDADASRVAFSRADTTTPQTAQAVADTVQNAQLAFPTKLAQFITAMASVFNETSRTNDTNERVVSRVVVHRASLLRESIAALATLSAQEARAAIRVDFVDEHGVDAGGVYREWFLLLNEAIITPEAGIFTCVDEHEQTFYLHPHSREVIGENHLAHFVAAGRLVGRALLDGNVTGFHLALPLLKLILGLPVAFSDLADFDPETHKNLTWLLEHDGAECLGLDFTVVEKLPGGRVKIVELVPKGSEIDVTDANKRHFVDRKLQYLLLESVQSQLFAFLSGLYEVVPAELLLLFDAAELDYLLAGTDAIDVDDWEAHTITSSNLSLHPAYFNFWLVVRELSRDEQRRLLQFATGATRVPPGGFSALTSHDGRLCLFSLHGVAPDSTWGCVHAHACFNRLDLPLVRDRAVLREAVRAAVASESVGFTTV